MSTLLPCLPFLAALGLAAASCTPPPPAAQSTGEPSFYTALTSADAKVDALAARDMISIYRANNGLPPLVIDLALQAAALAKARDMARAGTAGGRVSGIQRDVVVDNVSAGYHTLAEAFSGWRQSPQHNANMLNPAVRRIGIATAFAPGSKYKVFWALVLSD